MYKDKKLLKFFSLISLFFLISLISISCQSNQNPSKFKPQDLVGTWNCTDEGLTSDSFQLSAEGKITITANGQQIPGSLTIQNWDTDKVKEVGSYSIEWDTKIPNVGKFTFNFKSTTECDLTSSVMQGTQHFKK